MGGHEGFAIRNFLLSKCPSDRPLLLKEIKNSLLAVVV